ncbi:MAG: hypothetical protein JSR78_10350 [Proteobacteria bacterium]|nr:hypothetical protein [Pseudomonadota bacterium]
MKRIAIIGLLVAGSATGAEALEAKAIGIGEKSIGKIAGNLFASMITTEETMSPPCFCVRV